PSSTHEAAMPTQDRVRSDETVTTQCAGNRRTSAANTAGPPSPSAEAGLRDAAPQPRDAARGARRPWRRTCGPSAGPVLIRAKRSSTATAETRRDHADPQITAGQRPRPDFWHPTAALRMVHTVEAPIR